MNFFPLYFRAMCNFGCHEKLIKRIFASWIQQQSVLGFEEIRCLLFWYSYPENFITTNFTKKIIVFVKSRNNLVISLALSGFGVSFLFMGSVTSDFIGSPSVSISWKKKYFVWKSFQPNLTILKNHMKILWKKTNQNKQRVFRLLFRRKKSMELEKKFF